MQHYSPDGTCLKKFSHIGGVVRDLDASIQFYSALGIGPWVRRRISNAVSAVTPDPRLVHQDPAGECYEVAYARLGNGAFGIELLQPISGDSRARRFLETRGEGIWLYGFLVDDLNAAEAWMAEKGFNRLGSAQHAVDHRLSYYDTSANGGIILQLHEANHVELMNNLFKVQAEEFVSPVDSPLKQLSHVAGVVTNMDETLGMFARLGLGPWIRAIFPNPNTRLKSRTHNGRSGDDIVYDSSYARLGDVGLELFQCLQGDSIPRRFIERSGEGIWHICYLVDNIDTAAAWLEERGHKKVGEAQYESGGLRMAFHDTQRHGCPLVQLHEPDIEVMLDGMFAKLGDQRELTS